ncbi:MAG: response regulator transcription factor [Microbacterium arborescens]
MLGVLVLDAHDLTRRGIADTIDSAAGMQVVAEAATARQAHARAAVTVPDIAVLDAALPDGTGAEVCAALRAIHPRLRCLVLSTVDDEDARAAASAAGASGFATKDISAADLVDAVRRIASGHPWSSSLRPHAPAATAAPVHDLAPDDDLTNRQRAVLRLLARGLSNREIARELGVAEKTVKNHVTAILRALGVRRRTQAALIASRTSR